MAVPDFADMKWAPDFSSTRMICKKKGETVRFVLLKKLGVPIVNGSIPDNMLTKTLEGLKG